MRILLITTILGAVTLTAGCGSELTAGAAGLFAGFGSSETLDKIEADLDLQEQALIDKYNRMVDAGASADTLAEVRRDIENMVLLRQGVSTGKTLFGVDLNNPASAGRALAEVGMLAWLLLTQKKNRRTQAGVNKFMAQAPADQADLLYNAIKRKQAG